MTTEYEKNERYLIMALGIRQAINSNDLTEVRKLLIITFHVFNADSSYTPTTEEKEFLVFRDLYNFSNTMLNAKSLLKELILDYKISEENSIDKFKGEISQDVIDMFATRKLNEELKQELNTNDKQPNKKPKV
jgi:hypothetical protein